MCRRPAPVPPAPSRGGADPLLLGTVLLLCVALVAGGAVEFLRLSGARMLAHRTLQAAVAGAAESLTLAGPDQAEQAYWNLLRDSLDLDEQGRPGRNRDVMAGTVQAQVYVLPAGGRDPVTGTAWDGPAVVGTVRWSYRPLLLPLPAPTIEAHYGFRAP